MDLRCAAVASPVVLAAAANGQSPPDPTDTLARARDHLLERTERLPNYTCVQTVDRAYLQPANPIYPPPSCDVISGQKKRGH